MAGAEVGAFVRGAVLGAGAVGTIGAEDTGDIVGACTGAEFGAGAIGAEVTGESVVGLSLGGHVGLTVFLLFPLPPLPPLLPLLPLPIDPDFDDFPVSFAVLLPGCIGGESSYVTLVVDENGLLAGRAFSSLIKSSTSGGSSATLTS